MDLFEQALAFAMEKHSGQRRKTSALPFVLHPMEVATIVSTMSETPELLAAALLHDTIEDAGVTAEELRERFGDRVTELVLSETESKRRGTPAEDTWMARKTETLEILKNTDDIEIKKLWLGDKLSNMRSFYRLYEVEGKAMWQRFHQKDPAVQEWYYRQIAESLAVLEPYPAYREYVRLTETIFSEKE